jgi:4-hydroxybenzoate polyprenyltransferase
MSAPQFVLGVAFGWGVPMAYAAETGGIPRIGALLFLSAIIWGVVYDTEYAMVDRDDDLRIGMKTSAITLGNADVPVVMLCYACYLAIWAAVLAPRIPASVLALAIGAGAAQVVWHYRLIRSRERAGCFRAFRMNHWLGFTLFAAVVLGYAAR